MMNPLRDAAGDRPPGSDPASLPRLLQASHQQICVSRNLTTISLLSQLCQLLVNDNDKVEDNVSGVQSAG